VEKMLNIAQCNDREKVLYASGVYFLSLKQGNMSVSEYRDKFIQLSRYALDEVTDDERKQEHFIEGLIGPL
jgi:hypothetical protein